MIGLSDITKSYESNRILNKYKEIVSEESNQLDSNRFFNVLNEINSLDGLRLGLHLFLDDYWSNNIIKPLISQVGGITK